MPLVTTLTMTSGKEIVLTPPELSVRYPGFALLTMWISYLTLIFVSIFFYHNDGVSGATTLLWFLVLMLTMHISSEVDKRNGYIECMLDLHF